MLFSILTFVVLFSCTNGQLIPNVVLTGQPRVVARRMLNVDLNQAQQLAQVDDQNHLHNRVKILDANSHYLTGQETPVTIYRRVLRPAKISFIGKSVETDQLRGTNDAVELDSWALSKRPVISGAFLQAPQAFH